MFQSQHREHGHKLENRLRNTAPGSRWAQVNSVIRATLTPSFWYRHPGGSNLQQGPWVSCVHRASSPHTRLRIPQGPKHTVSSSESKTKAHECLPHTCHCQDQRLVFPPWLSSCRSLPKAIWFPCDETMRLAPLFGGQEMEVTGRLL